MKVVVVVEFFAVFNTDEYVQLFQKLNKSLKLISIHMSQ